MMWTLIVMLTQAPAGVPSQLAVPGFTSQVACAAAGQSYFGELRRFDPAHVLTFAAVCVPASAMPAPTPAAPATPPPPATPKSK
jgi:hypothetical protein